MNTFVSFSIAKKIIKFFLFIHFIYSCRCLHYFGSTDKLDIHDVNCRALNDCAIWLPSKEDKWLNFKNQSNKEQLSFVVYADLECVLRKIEPDTEHVIHIPTSSGI